MNSGKIFILLLYGLILIAVTVDAALLPYYPFLFTQQFNASAPTITGNYLAATCLTVMLAVPLWNKVSQRIGLLKLLLLTQTGAAVCALLCSLIRDLPLFFWCSLTMIALKGSYLLIYPFVMRMRHSSQHGNTVQMLAVLVQAGLVLGAAMGSVFIAQIPIHRIFYVMATGDVLQTLICGYLLLRYQSAPNGMATADADIAADTVTSKPATVWWIVLAMLIFYAANFLIRPFFVEYWLAHSTITTPLVAGVVYAIPALVAMAAIGIHHYYPLPRLRNLFFCSALLVPACLLQLLPSVPAIILGRMLLGWGLFQVTVRLDLLVYANSSRQDYGKHYTYINFAQNLAVVGSYYLAGFSVKHYGLSSPLWLAAAVFAALLLYVQCTSTQLQMPHEKHVSV